MISPLFCNRNVIGIFGQTLQHGGRPTVLGRAIGELGRIYKTRYLLAYLDDEGYRQRILTQLNRGEARHSLRACGVLAQED